jgi:hypothetical protein
LAVTAVGIAVAVAAVALRPEADQERRHIDVFPATYTSRDLRKQLEVLQSACEGTSCIFGLGDVRSVLIRVPKEQPRKSWSTQLREWCADFSLCEPANNIDLQP